MAENGVSPLVVNDQVDTRSYDNDGFHSSDKPKKRMTTTTLLNGEADDPNIQTTKNGHIPITTTISCETNNGGCATNNGGCATNKGASLLNGHTVDNDLNDPPIITNGHSSDVEENVNLNCNSMDKELSKCPLDTKLRHYVPCDTDGKELNSDDTRIAIPDDAVINFNTGRIRLSKIAANSPHFNELCDENDCEKEKIPLQDFSAPIEEDNPKAIEAGRDLHQNGHGPDDHQYSDGKEVTLTAEALTKEKLQQSNGTGKFEEYFIPVNTHKKYLRGEKLYLTKDNPKLCQNWRRCIICGLISIVIAVAVLVGVLAATGILLAESDNKSTRHELNDLPDMASIAIAGTAGRRSNPPPSSNVPLNKTLYSTTVEVPVSTTTEQSIVTTVTSQTPLKVSSIVPVLRNASQLRTIVPNALVGEFTLVGEIFTDDLKDNTSFAFLSLATHIESELSRIMLRNGGEFRTLKVLKFSPGSIAVRFVVVWENPRHVILAKNAHEIMSAYIENRNGLFLAYPIDANNLNFTDVVDECAIQNGECSQSCSWSYLTLTKTCFCDDDMMLTDDGKTCVEKRKLSSTTDHSMVTTSVLGEMSTEITSTDVPETVTAFTAVAFRTTFTSTTNQTTNQKNFPSNITFVPTVIYADVTPTVTSASLPTTLVTTTENVNSETTFVTKNLESTDEIIPHDHNHESHDTTQMPSTIISLLNSSASSSVESTIPPLVSKQLTSTDSTSDNDTVTETTKIYNDESTETDNVPSSTELANKMTDQNIDTMPILVDTTSEFPQETTMKPTTTQGHTIGNSALDVPPDNTDLIPAYFATTNAPPATETEDSQNMTVTVPPVFPINDNTVQFSSTREPSLTTQEMNTESIIIVGDMSTNQSLTTAATETEPSVNIPKIVTEPSLFNTEAPLTNPMTVVTETELLETTTSTTKTLILAEDTTMDTTVEPKTDPFTPETTQSAQSFATPSEVTNNTESTQVLTETAIFSEIIDENENNTSTSTLTNITEPSKVPYESMQPHNISDFASNETSTATPQHQSSKEMTTVTESMDTMTSVTDEETKFITEVQNETIMPFTFRHVSTLTEIKDINSEDVPTTMLDTVTTPVATEMYIESLTETLIENATNVTPNVDSETTMMPIILTTSDILLETTTELPIVSSDTTLNITPNPIPIITSTTASPIDASTLNETNTTLSAIVIDIETATEFLPVEIKNETNQTTLETNETNEMTTADVGSVYNATNFDFDSTVANESSTDDTLQNMTTEIIYSEMENTTMVFINETNLPETNSENNVTTTIERETELTTTQTDEAKTSAAYRLTNLELGSTDFEFGSTDPELGSSSTIEDFDTYNSTLNTTVLNATDVEVECRDDQFLCESLNVCLNNTVICDGIADCPNGFDESNCTENCHLNFKCANSSMCITNNARCDSIWDCDDGSDEEECRPVECAQHEVMCTDGSVCIKPVHICDNLYNCKDRSDEGGCVERTTCESGGRFFCNDGLCIPWALKCDGEFDCKDKEDEGNCTCLVDDNEFRCNDGKCLKSSMRCDGHKDCINGEDELGCVKVDSQNMVVTYEPYSNSWSMLCAEDWNFDDGQYLCQELGYGHALSTEKFHVSFNGTWMAMKRANLTSTSLWTERVSFAESCSSSSAASVICQKFDCGNYSGLLHRRRKRQIDSTSSSTHWPFIAYISTFKSNGGCLAEILTPIWLITSAECLLAIGAETQNASIWYARTNVANIVDKSLAQNHEVQRIIIHQHSSKFRSLALRDYDVAMIRLKHSLVFSDKIGAICLPEEQVPSGITCFTGVFSTEKPKGPPPESLSINSLALMLLDREFCNKLEHYNETVNQRMLCTKSSDSQSVCDNDEGTPLMCLSGPNKWYLAGMLTYQRYCGIYSWHPDIFSNLHAMKKDIDQITGQKNYEVPFNPNMYIIVPPTTIGPTETTTIETTTITTVSNANLLLDISVNVSSPPSSNFPRSEDHDRYIELNGTEGNTTDYEDSDLAPFNMSSFEESRSDNSTGNQTVSIDIIDQSKSVQVVTAIGNMTYDDIPTLGPSGFLNGTNEFSPLIQPPEIEMLDDNSTFPDLYMNFTTLSDVSDGMADSISTTEFPSTFNASDSQLIGNKSSDDVASPLLNFTTSLSNISYTETTVENVNSSEGVISLYKSDPIFNSADEDSTNRNLTNATLMDAPPTSTVPATQNTSTVMAQHGIGNASSGIYDVMLSDSAHAGRSHPPARPDIIPVAEEITNLSSIFSIETTDSTTLSSVTENVILPDFQTLEPPSPEILKEFPVKSAKLLEETPAFNDSEVKNDTLVDEISFEDIQTASNSTFNQTSSLDVDLRENDPSLNSVLSTQSPSTTTEAAMTVFKTESTASEIEEKFMNDTLLQNSTTEVAILSNETILEEIITAPSNETASEETITAPSNETVSEKTITAPSNETVSEEAITAPSNETVSEETITAPSNETVSEETITAPSNKTIAEEIVTIPPNGTVLEEVTSAENATSTISIDVVTANFETEMCGKWEQTLNSTQNVFSEGGLKLWPSIGFLQQKVDQKECICNILSSRYVITPVSCLLLRDNLLNPENWVFTISEFNVSSNMSKIAVEEIIEYPERKIPIVFAENDLALVKLKDSIEFSENSAPVCLPLRSVAPGDNCFSTGWIKNISAGGIKDHFFSQKSTIVSQEDCNNSQNYNGTVMDTMICSEPSEANFSACEMDVGSPLICHSDGRWELQGIYPPHILCNPTKPAVYNNIKSAEKWIKKIVFQQL